MSEDYKRVYSGYGKHVLVEKLYRNGTAVNLSILPETAEMARPGFTFEREQIIDLIHALADAINYTAKLEKIPEPVYLPSGIGAVIDSGLSKYVRVSASDWKVIGPGGGLHSEERMREVRNGLQYTILSEGVDL